MINLCITNHTSVQPTAFVYQSLFTYISHLSWSYTKPYFCMSNSLILTICTLCLIYKYIYFKMSLQLHQTPMLGYRPVPKKLPDGSQTDHSDPNGVPDHSLTAFSWMYGPLPFRFGTPLWAGVCHGHGLRLVDKFYPAAAELLTTNKGWPCAAKSCV